MSMIVRDYIPENSRDLPIYSKIAELLQELSNVPSEFYTALEVFYDALETEDVDILSKLVGADTLFEIISLSDAEKRRFLSAVKAVWSLKGTDRGILFALSIFGVKARIAKWYEPDVFLNECEIDIEIDVRQNPVGQDTLDLIEQLVSIFSSVCLKLVNIGYVFRITSTVDDPQSFMVHEDELYLTSCIFYDAAAMWKINPNLWKIGQEVSPGNPLQIGEFVPAPYEKATIYILPDGECWNIPVGNNFYVGQEYTYTSGCIEDDPYCQLLKQGVDGTLPVWFINDEPCCWFVGEDGLEVGEKPPRPLKAYECCCNDNLLFSQIKIIVEES